VYYNEIISIKEYIMLNINLFSILIRKIFQFCFLFSLAIIISSCENSKETPPAKIYKIGMLAEKFGIDSYNDNSKQGLLDLNKEIPIFTDFRDGVDSLTMLENFNYFMSRNIDLLFYVGYNFTDFAIEKANKTPYVDFAFIDYDLDTIPKNMIGVAFEVQEAAFPLGFLAAYWADFKNPDAPKTAAICGFDSKTLQKFYVAFDNGVKYYNSIYSKNVVNSTVFSYSFHEKQIGRQIADSLVNEGVSVLFTVAGSCGVGAIEVASERHIWAIGVDEDQYLTLPDTLKSILLSSCIKDTRVTVYNIAKDYVNGKFNKGTIQKANLSSSGVAIAPYHNFDNQIPESIKAKIEEIKNDIISGKINPME